jgi:Mg/Co/Ni transporter MgtE
VQPIQVSIRDEEMLMEAIFLFDKYQVNILPVVHEEEVSGLIHLDDIIGVIADINGKDSP